jgi:hypothetical protein
LANRGRSLAAASAAATTLVFLATAAAQEIQLAHGIHLLSYRRLSIELNKKIGGSARLLSNLIG